MATRSASPAAPLFAGLYYWKWDESRNLSKHVLAPFFATKRSDYEKYDWTLNYYSYESEYRKELDVYPFYGEKTLKDGYDGNVTESTWILWPLYSKSETRNPKGELLRRKKRFAFFTNELDSKGRRVFSILGHVVREKVN